MHALWNAVLKIRLDPFLALALISGACTVLALPFALALGPPPPQAWPWIAGSISVHMIYYLTLTSAYRIADMGLVYPIARGGSPLITTLISLILLGEAIDAQGVLGVGVLALGVLTVAWQPKGSALNRRALILSASCAVAIAIYSVIDGLGARSTGNAHLYASWLFVIEGPFVLAMALFLHGRSGIVQMRGFLGPGLLGGLMALGGYWTTIWAMTQAPIGLVTAVRESSVMFAALLGIFILRERPSVRRLAGTALIVAGLALIKLH